MAENAAGVTIDRRGDAFILRRRGPRGRQTQITLSANDILLLAQHVINLRQTAMAIVDPQGVGGFHATPVERVHATQDALLENVLIGMGDQSGGSTIYQLAPSLALDLVERIRSALAEIQSSRPRAH